MANHKLSISVVRTLNPEVLMLIDTSVYSEVIPVDCPLLEITVPGFSRSCTFENLDVNFSKVITACDLELTTGDCTNTKTNLPDGVYAIRYSVSPNSVVKVEYNHLRTTNLELMYSERLCEMDLGDCEPSSSTKAKMLLLDEIGIYIKAAVAHVEVCHHSRKGMQLYTYAKKLLQRLDCKNC